MAPSPVARPQPDWIARRLPPALARRWQRSRRTGGYLWALPALLWLVAAFIFLTTMATLAAVASPMPLDDEWIRVLEIAREARGDFTFTDLWTQHNEHRFVLPRLFIFADFWFFGGENTFSTVVAIAFQAGTAALLTLVAYRVFRDTAHGVKYGTTFAGLSIALLFAANQMEILQQYIINFAGFWFFAVLAVVLVDGAAAPDAHTRRRWLLLGGAGVAALLAHLCLASGPVVWLAVALLAFVGGQGWRLALALAVIGAAFTAFYFVGYSRPAVSASPIDSLQQPGDLVVFSLALIGNPLVSFGEGWALAGGIAGVAGFVAVVVAALRVGREKSRPIFACVSIMLMVLLATVTTASGRLNEGTSGAVFERYVTGSSIFWLGLGVALAWFAHGAGTLPHRRAAGAFVAVSMGAILVSAVWSQVEVPQRYRERDRTLALPADAILTGVLDPEALAFVYPRAGTGIVAAQVPFLKRHEYSLFHGSDDGELLGTKLDSFAVLIPEGRCQGNFDSSEPVSGVAGGSRVSGWAWDDQRQAPIGRILLADRENTVVGLASTSLLRPDVVNVVGIVRTPRVGWIGYALPAQTPLKAYGVLESGAVCPLFGELPSN